MCQLFQDNTKQQYNNIINKNGQAEHRIKK